MKKQYSEKLRDPRWQKMRLEIFGRDEWCCQSCFDSESTLAVHHLYYLPNKEPWDYPLEALKTLCEACHNYEYETRAAREEDLLLILKQHDISSDGIHSLSSAFIAMPDKFAGGAPPNHIPDVLQWLLSNHDELNKVIDRYWECLHIQAEKKKNGLD